MIRPDNSEKALVLYCPALRKRSLGGFADGLFLSRKAAYLFFLSLFFFVSAFARCLSLRNPVVSSEAYGDLLSCSLSGRTVLIFRFCFPHLLCSLLAFLSGFTIFALPVAVLGFLRSLFSLSFFYFALTEGASGYDFYKGLAALLHFSLFAAASVFFYSGLLFVGRNRTPKRLVLSCFVYLAYFFTAIFILRYFSTAFFY